MSFDKSNLIIKKHLFKKGQVAHNKGKKASLEIRRKISQTTKKAMTPEVRLKISLSRKQVIYSQAHRKAISLGNKGKTSGEKHWNWKGGYSRKIGDMFYISADYKEWRMKVFRRDEFICVICKIPNKRLQADHIKPKCLYPELIFSLDNGRTLCEDCHKQTSTYGVNKIYMSNKNIWQEVRR